MVNSMSPSAIDLLDFIKVNPGKTGHEICKTLHLAIPRFGQLVHYLIDEQLVYDAIEGKDSYNNPVRFYYAVKPIPGARRIMLTDNVIPATDTAGCVNGQLQSRSMLDDCSKS